MKILYLLIVYRSPEIVKRIISRLDNGKNLFMVHVDASAKDDFSQLVENHNVHLASKRYSTPWGSPDLVFAVLDSLKEAAQWDWDYVCLLSESDYPVKTADYISSYLSNSGKDHILINELPCDNPLEVPGGHWLEGGRRRTDCYALRLQSKQIATIEPRKFDFGNFRQFIKVFRYNPGKLMAAMRIFFFYPVRKSTTDALCGGHQWFFLKRRTTDAIAKFVADNYGFMADCVNTQCLDEIFFPTVVNQVVNRKDISKNILRYISWKSDGASSPVDITMDDKEIINECIDKSDVLFIRKVAERSVCDYIDRFVYNN